MTLTGYKTYLFGDVLVRAKPDGFGHAFWHLIYPDGQESLCDAILFEKHAKEIKDASDS